MLELGVLDLASALAGLCREFDCREVSATYVIGGRVLTVTHDGGRCTISHDDDQLRAVPPEDRA
jgi:hypothetical protein